MQQEIERGARIHSEFADLENVALKLLEHWQCVPIFEQGYQVLQRQDHLLVQLDGDLETDRVDDFEEGWLDVGVAPEVSISDVEGLEDSLVEAVCLDGELDHRQTSLLPHLLIDFADVH